MSKDAAVVTKIRQRRDGAVEEVHYFIGPERDTKQAAEADMERWAESPLLHERLSIYKKMNSGGGKLLVDERRLMENLDQFLNWKESDRQDAVAVALRRFTLRVDVCPCLHNPPCQQCELDSKAIVNAFSSGGMKSKIAEE